MEKIKKVIEETVETSFDQATTLLDLNIEGDIWNKWSTDMPVTDQQLLNMALQFDCSVSLIKLLIFLLNHINANNKLLNDDIRELAECVLD